MSLELTSVEVRVLGALMEKDMTTPEYYPMSLHALTAACNQKSNRDPVTSFDEEGVQEALDSLRAKLLSTVLTGREMRVPKFGHRASETLNLGNRELAVLCVLLLRGPQTVGEIKQRTERMYPFDDLESVDAVLRKLSEHEPEPLAVLLPRQAGTREARWAHRLSSDPLDAAPGPSPAHASSSSAERLAALEAEVAALREEVDGVKQTLAEFRRQFE